MGISFFDILTKDVRDADFFIKRADLFGSQFLAAVFLRGTKVAVVKHGAGIEAGSHGKGAGRAAGFHSQSYPPRLAPVT